MSHQAKTVVCLSAGSAPTLNTVDDRERGVVSMNR